MTVPNYPGRQDWAVTAPQIVPLPVHKRWWFRIVVAVGVICTITGMVIVGTVIAEMRKEDEINARISETAIDGCTDAITRQAKYPAAAEFDDPLDPLPRKAEAHQGSPGTAFITVNLGTIQFVNGFGVPSPYYYGCVSYHDEEGKLLNSRTKTKKGDSVLNSIAYLPESDRLS